MPWAELYVANLTSYLPHLSPPISKELQISCCFFILFRDTRSSVFEESLRKLGVEKLSKDDVQKMQWEVLEAKIGNWIHFMRIAVRIYVKFG